MRQIFLKAIQFIKENPRIIYSLVLVVILPAAFFINTYLINSNYEKNIDKITQRKAVLVENIVNSLLQDRISNENELQSLVEKIQEEKDEIISLSIAKPQNDPGEFQIVASSEPALVGQKQSGSIQNAIAWEKPEGVAFLDRNDKGRFWNVTKTLLDESGNKIGLIAMAFSLTDSDALVQRTIYNSYWVLMIIIITVVLLVANQGRLFGYALTVTKLKEIDKMKDMFISMASHELRTPLTAIKGYVELLKEKKEIQSDQQSSHFMNNISISVERLQDLINDVLEVSRVEGNRLPMEIIEFDPSEAISESVEEMRSQAQDKGLNLNLQPLETLVAIKNDKDRLKQVLINLIGNSVKYTLEGSVDVSAKIKGKELLITVADTGIGISSEDQANLFQKFYRIQNEHTKNVTGTGLGLWITSEIVKKMDGSITVESIEGVGSHFTIHLPFVEK
jgi:signal transduction histidine kinase